jgi:sugar phosphate isomerase/epimerase
MKTNTRREFIAKSITAVAGVSVGLNAYGSTNKFLSGFLKAKTIRPIHIFTKCLQFLNYNEMAEMVAKHGFDGADLTVRSGGQVLPENVETDLPKALRALRKAGVTSNMIVTNVNDPADRFTRPILKTMAGLGIKYYRMGYFDFDAGKSIPQNLDEIKRSFEKLEKLNREFGVCGNYQNHSGTRVGGPVWDLYHLLKDCDPAFIGVQYDVRHATVEGGVSWPLGMKLLAPWIQTTDIKDFIWQKNETGNWQIVNVPLGEGMVDFKQYFEIYKSMKIEAPISIHYEYDLGGAEHGNSETTISIEKIEAFLKADIEFLKSKLIQYGL